METSLDLPPLILKLDINWLLQSEAVVYQTDWRYSDDEIYFKTYQPSSYSFLTQWYSASGSYIYIKDIDGKVKCDEPLFLDVFYNAPPESTYTFFAIVSHYSLV